MFIRGFALRFLSATPITIEDYSMRDILEGYIAHSVVHSIEDRDAWERARMISLFTSAPHSKKKLTAKDIVVFSWEQKGGQKGTPSNKWTKEEIEKLKKEGHPIFR